MKHAVFSRRVGTVQTRTRFAARNLRTSFLIFLLMLATAAYGASPVAAQTSSRSTANRLLILSDLHFNPMADAGLVADLDAADPAQWTGILGRSKPTAFSQYGQDTNWWLLQSALDQAHKTIPRPAFIIIDGDSLAHHFPQLYQSITHAEDREHYRKFVLKTMQFLALQLRKRYPNTRIFLTPGNNDDECGNYSIEARGRFLHDTANLVRNLARGDDAMQASWESLGSFEVALPTVRGVRIISLNSIFFSEKYQAQQFSDNCAVVPSPGPTEAFAWLESRLNEAQAAHQKVWLMFHIPPGIDGYSTAAQYQTLTKSKPASEQLCTSAIVPMWVPEWTAQFDNLLEKYRGTVIVALAGHTHTDDFRVIDPTSSDPPYVLISPAISPIYNQNPAFRTATYAKDGSLLDASVYYLSNLTYASQSTPGEWQLEYTFSKQWKLPRIDGANLAALYTKIAADESTRNDWLKLYNTSSSAAYLPPGSALGLSCAAEGLDAASYGSCYCSAKDAPTAPAKP
jgi:sphingomyelin phosphodiesterase acid-like 3